MSYSFVIRRSSLHAEMERLAEPAPDAAAEADPARGRDFRAAAQADAQQAFVVVERSHRFVRRIERPLGARRRIGLGLQVAARLVTQLARRILHVLLRDADHLAGER